MPLEQDIDQKTDVFIDYLNPSWPPGSDKPFQGDDHIRGIKRVLQNTFPTLNGQVTRKLADLNAGSCPAGMQILCCSNFLPTGWQQVTGVADTKMLRVVASGTLAGGTPAGVVGGLGGTDDPVLNDKAPDHTHSVAAVATGTESADHAHRTTANTGTESHDHAHSGSTGTESHDHTHYNGVYGGSSPYYPTAGGQVAHIGMNANYGTSGRLQAHTHAFTTGGRNQAHTHYLDAWSGGRNATHTHTVPAHNTAGVNSPSNWTPRYINSFLIYRVPLA